MTEPMAVFNMDDCSQDPENCPIVAQAFEIDTFEEQIQDIDPSSLERRERLANFVVACAKGNCPGQSPEFFIQFIRKRQQDNS